MKKSDKMNFLFKIAFIILLLCVPLTISAIIAAYLFKETYLSAVFSAGGAALAFIGIILAMLSKPKKMKSKKRKRADNEVESSDSIDKDSSVSKLPS